MVRKSVLSLLILALSATLSMAALADTAPSMHQVYEAAQSGNFTEADQMMATVLQQHPNSAKAHFVEAELLAKEGHLNHSRSELATARQLDPQLAFAKPGSVAGLDALLSGAPISQAVSQNIAPHFPWGLLFFGIAAIFLVFWIMRRFARPQYTTMSPGPYYTGNPNGMPPNNMPGTPYGGSPMMPMGGGGMMGGGMGGGIVSNLVTGAAVGAGMVAGEELVHHMMDGGTSNPMTSVDNQPWSDPSGGNNMGGNDFGISDGGSWDDGSSSGGDW